MTYQEQAVTWSGKFEGSIKKQDMGITDISDLVSRMNTSAGRQQVLDNYDLINQETNTRYGLGMAMPTNSQKSGWRKFTQAANRFLNPLYRYNIGNSLNYETQSDIVRGVAELQYARNQKGADLTTDEARDVIKKTAHYGESKKALSDIAVKHYIDISAGGISGGGVGGISGGVGGISGGVGGLTPYYNRLEDSLDASDKIFTQRRLAFSTDLAMYGKAALAGGIVAAATCGTGGIALAAGLGALGAYATRSLVGTTLGTVVPKVAGNSGLATVGTALALSTIAGLGVVGLAYAGIAGLNYANVHSKKNIARLQQTIDDPTTNIADRVKAVKQQNRNNSFYHSTKWASGLATFTLPVIAGFDYISTDGWSINDFTGTGTCAQEIPTESSTESGNLPDIPEHHVCPVECFDIDSLYGQYIRGIDLHEKFLDHGTRLKGEFHELGLHLNKTNFDDGSVTLNGLHDAHTPEGYNLDDTIIMAEGYDASGKLEFRQFYDVNADGKFTLNGFDETQYSNWQITWAEAECVDGNLELNDLSSYTHGKVPLSETWEAPAVDKTPTSTHVPDGDHILRITPEKTNDGGIAVYDSWNHGTELCIDVYGVDNNYVLGSVRDIPAGAGTAHISGFADNLPAGSYVAHISGSDAHGLHADYTLDFLVGTDTTPITTQILGNTSTPITAQILGNTSTPITTQTLGITSLYNWNIPSLEHGIPTGYQSLTASVVAPVDAISASATSGLDSWDSVNLDSGMPVQNMYTGTTPVEHVANITTATSELRSWDSATLDSGMSTESGTAILTHAQNNLHDWSTPISLDNGLPANEMVNSALTSISDVEQEQNIPNWSDNTNDGNSDMWIRNIAPEEFVSYRPANNSNGFIFLNNGEEDLDALLREILYKKAT